LLGARWSEFVLMQTPLISRSKLEKLFEEFLLWRFVARQERDSHRQLAFTPG
jgi:hypothetical protein